MKLYKNRLFLGLAILLFITVNISLAGSDHSRVGTRAYSFLKIEVAARPVSMGGAFTGVADDASSLYYNPAGIAGLEGKGYILGFHDNIFDMQSGFVGYIHPWGESRKISVYFDYLNYGDFIRTDNMGNEEGNFSGSDILFGFGYAMKANEKLQLGGTVKLIYEKIDVYSSHGFAVDLGTKYSVNYGRTNFGLMVQNLGVQLSGFVDNSDKYPLPLRFRIGASSRLKGLPVILAGDLIYPADNDPYVAVGTEIVNLKPLFIRFGWSSFGSNFKTGASNDDIGGFSAGFGINHRQMQISYSISPQAELGTSHRVTLMGGL